MLQSYFGSDIFDVFQYDELCRRAIKLFYVTGHTFNDEPFAKDREIKDLVYIDIKHTHVFTPNEWSVLNLINKAAFLFTNGAAYFGLAEADESIDYFAISLNTSDSDRSQLAYDVHQVISQLSPSALSVVLVEANSNYMFSFAKRRSKQRSIIILSDWYSVQEMQNDNLIDMIDAGYLSGDGAVAFFEDFIYAVAREYYIHPITYGYALEMLPPDLLNGTSVIDRETINDIIQENFMYFSRKYLEDYVYEDIYEDEALLLNTDDYTLDLYELELNIDTEETSENIYDEDYSVSNEDDFYGDDDEDSLFDNLDEDLFSNPIKLIKWMTDNSSGS